MQDIKYAMKLIRKAVSHDQNKDEALDNDAAALEYLDSNPDLLEKIVCEVAGSPTPDESQLRWVLGYCSDRAKRGESFPKEVYTSVVKYQQHESIYIRSLAQEIVGTRAGQ